MTFYRYFEVLVVSENETHISNEELGDLHYESIVSKFSLFASILPLVILTISDVSIYSYYFLSRKYPVSMTRCTLCYIILPFRQWYVLFSFSNGPLKSALSFPTCMKVIRERFNFTADNIHISNHAFNCLKKSFRSVLFALFFIVGFNSFYPINSMEKGVLCKQEAMTLLLAYVLADIRPELDLYNFTDLPVERVAAAHRSPFRRIFYNQKGDVQVIRIPPLAFVAQVIKYFLFFF